MLQMLHTEISSTELSRMADEDKKQGKGLQWHTS